MTTSLLCSSLSTNWREELDKWIDVCLREAEGEYRSNLKEISNWQEHVMTKLAKQTKYLQHEILLNWERQKRYLEDSRRTLSNKHQPRGEEKDESVGLKTITKTKTTTKTTKETGGENPETETKVTKALEATEVEILRKTEWAQAKEFGHLTVDIDRSLQALSYPPLPDTLDAESLDAGDARITLNPVCAASEIRFSVAPDTKRWGLIFQQHEKADWFPKRFLSTRSQSQSQGTTDPKARPLVSIYSERSLPGHLGGSKELRTKLVTELFLSRPPSPISSAFEFYGRYSPSPGERVLGVEFKYKASQSSKDLDMFFPLCFVKTTVSVSAWLGEKVPASDGRKSEFGFAFNVKSWLQTGTPIPSYLSLTAAYLSLTEQKIATGERQMRLLQVENQVAFPQDRLSLNILGDENDRFLLLCFANSSQKIESINKLGIFPSKMVFTCVVVKSKGGALSKIPDFWISHRNPASLDYSLLKDSLLKGVSSFWTLCRFEWDESQSRYGLTWQTKKSVVILEIPPNDDPKDRKEKQEAAPAPPVPVAPGTTSAWGAKGRAKDDAKGDHEFELVRLEHRPPFLYLIVKERKTGKVHIQAHQWEGKDKRVNEFPEFVWSLRDEFGKVISNLVSVLFLLDTPFMVFCTAETVWVSRWENEKEGRGHFSSHAIIHMGHECAITSLGYSQGILFVVIDKVANAFDFAYLLTSVKW